MEEKNGNLLEENKEKTCCEESCEDCKCQKKKHFALITLTFGEILLGKVLEEAYTAWAVGARLVVEDPKLIKFDPIQKGNRVVGYTLLMLPMHPMKTDQHNVLMDPSLVELLGVWNEDANGDVILESTNEYVRNELAKRYVELLEQWRAELSGIIRPTTDDILSTDPNAPIPFNRKKQ